MNLNRRLLLASNSPRRQELLRALGYAFEVQVKNTEEDFPAGMPGHEVAEFLARKKAAAFSPEEIGDTILITADTVVCLDDHLLNKPATEAQAREMLRQLSGRSHSVITGVCLRNASATHSFSDETKVFFKELTEAEISYYISRFQPFDKAGAYGVQEWIGMIGVTRLEGSYFTVMGLPVQRLYEELENFGTED